MFNSIIYYICVYYVDIDLLETKASNVNENGFIERLVK